MIPINPYFDEDYSDNKSDKKIKEITEKYGLKLKWPYWIYPK